MEEISFFRTVTFFIRRIWVFSKTLSLVCLCYIFINALIPFIAIFGTAAVIDVFTTDRDMNRLIFIVAAIISALLFTHIMKPILMYVINVFVLRLEDELRLDLGRKGMTLDYRHLENPAVLEQCEKAKTGMSFYSGGIKGFIECLLQMMSSGVTLVGTILIILSLNYWIILILLALVFANFFIQNRVKKLDVAFWGQMVSINRTYFYFYDMLKDYKNGKDIRLLNAFPLISSQLDKFIARFDKVSGRHFGKIGTLGIFEAVVLGTELLIVNGYLAIQVVFSAMTLTSFAMYVGASTAFITSFKSIVEQILDIRKKAQFMSEYIKFIEIKNTNISGDRKIADDSNYTLEFVNVSFSYPGSKEKVLRNISFKLDPGDRLSIVGMNGAGKTTIVKLITRLYDPIEGQILLNGIDIREYDYQAYQDLFSAVFQDFTLFAFSLKENVAAGDTFDEPKFESSLQKAGMLEWVKKAKRGAESIVYKYFDEDGIEFSGGEAQKIAISRAYYKDSKVIILDEPTAALDPFSEDEIYRRFNELIGDKTAIYISHRMSSCKFCERILVLDQGEIVECGSHAELMKNNGKYAELFNVQQQYYH